MLEFIKNIKNFFERKLKTSYDIDELTAVEQKEVIRSIIKEIRNSNELF